MMKYRVKVLNRCVLLGILAGIRSFSAPALVFAGLAGKILRIAAAGEMIGDKLPGIPPRTDPIPLIGRGLTAAASVYPFARKEGFHVGIPISVASAMLSAVVFTRSRKTLSECFSIPDRFIGVLEDALVLRIARLAARA